MTEYRKSGTFEKPMATAQGLAMLLAMLVLFAVAAYCFYARALFPGLGLLAAGVFVAAGFFMLQPNEAVVLTLFGDYLGTERRPGLRWTLPWNIRKKLSARIRNYNVETLKVNDKRRAAMVSNLMVVLCSERDTQPIVNAGSLYQ